MEQKINKSLDDMQDFYTALFTWMGSLQDLGIDTTVLERADEMIYSAQCDLEELAVANGVEVPE